MEHGVTSLGKHFTHGFRALNYLIIDTSEVLVLLTLIWLRKALPRPWPSLAPLTRPAMSVTLRKAGTWTGEVGKGYEKWINLLFFNRKQCSPPCWQVYGELPTNPTSHQGLLLWPWGGRQDKEMWRFLSRSHLVGVDCTEGEVLSSSLAALGQHVEEGWLRRRCLYHLITLTENILIAI